MARVAKPQCRRWRQGLVQRDFKPTTLKVCCQLVREGPVFQAESDLDRCHEKTTKMKTRQPSPLTPVSGGFLCGASHSLNAFGTLAMSQATRGSAVWRMPGKARLWRSEERRVGKECR